jgi:hypothetical protein
MQSSIKPVAVYPAIANTLMIRSGGLGPPPSYYYELQNVTDGVVVVLKNGNAFMTQEQWAAWPADADDDAVQLAAISENLGLTLVSEE